MKSEMIQATEVWYSEEDILKDCLISGDMQGVYTAYHNLKKAIYKRFSPVMDESFLIVFFSSLLGGVIHYTCKEGNVPAPYLALIIMKQYDMTMPRKDYYSEKIMDEVLMEYLNYISDVISQFNKKNYSFHIDKAIEYIQNHITEKISLENVAEYLQLSPQYLSALFHKEVQSSISEYIHIQKINLAKEYLKQRNINITQIASICGFEDSNYFTRIFKKYTKLTPTQYRKKKY